MSLLEEVGIWFPLLIDLSKYCYRINFLSLYCSVKLFTGLNFQEREVVEVRLFLAFEDFLKQIWPHILVLRSSA